MNGEIGAAGDARVRRLVIFAAFVVALFGVGLASAWALRELVLLTFFAVLLAVLLRSAADWISTRTGLGPAVAVVIVMLATLGLAALAIVLLVPTLIAQGREFAERLPAILDAAQRRLGDQPILSDLWQQAQGQLQLPSAGAAVSQLGTVLGFVSASASNFVFLLFATIFLALSPQTYVAGLRWLVPPAHRGFTVRLLDELGGTLRSWFGGQLVMMVGVGALAALGLWALGVPYALALGVFAGLLDFVPYVGPFVGAAPAVLVAFSASPTTALWVVLLFVVVQQIEGNVLGPVVQENAVSIPPALLLVFLFAMGQLFGLAGLLVATPLLAVLLVAVKRIYVERILDGTDKAGQAE